MECFLRDIFISLLLQCMIRYACAYIINLRNNIEVDPKGSQEYERPSASYRRNVTPSYLPL